MKEGRGERGEGRGKEADKGEWEEWEEKNEWESGKGRVKGGDLFLSQMNK